MQDRSGWLSSCKDVWCSLYDNHFSLLPFFNLFLVCCFAHQWSFLLDVTDQSWVTEGGDKLLQVLKFVFIEESRRFFLASCSILGCYIFQYLFEILISPWIFCIYCLICFFVGFSLLGLGWLVCLFRLFEFEVCYSVTVLPGSNSNISLWLAGIGIELLNAFFYI